MRFYSVTLLTFSLHYTTPTPTIVHPRSEGKPCKNRLMGQNSPKTPKNGCLEVLKTPAGTMAYVRWDDGKVPAGR